MFAEHGYAGVGLDAVAAESAVTRGAVYNHFVSKRGLFAAVFSDVQHTVADAVLMAAENTDGAWEGFLAGCRAFLVAASLDDSVRRIMLVDAPAVLGWNAWPAGDSANSGKFLDEGLRELPDAGLVKHTPIAETGALLSGAMNAAALQIGESEHPDQALELSWVVLARLLESLR